MFEVLLLVLGLLVFVAGLMFVRHYQHTHKVSESKGNEARAHRLCMQALEIERMENSYLKIQANEQWRAQLMEYGQSCQQEEQDNNQTGSHLKIV